MDESEPEQATANAATAAKMIKIKCLRTVIPSQLKIYPDRIVAYPYGRGLKTHKPNQTGFRHLQTDSGSEEILLTPFTKGGR